MIPFFVIFRKLTNTVRKGIGILSGSVSTIAVVIYGTFSEYYLENPLPNSGIHSLFTSLWWTMQTLTTVGYGDTAVVGYAGRLNAMFVMVVGIGSLGFLLASVSANIVNSKISKRLGSVKIRLRNHAVICNYDPAGKEIIRSLNKEGIPVVLVSNKEISGEGLEFDYVKGTCLDKEALRMAGIEKSDSAIILAGKYVNEEEAVEVDARTILMGMTIKKISPETRVIAEILEHDSEEHAINAGIDETIVRGNLSSMLLSRSIRSPGVTRLLKDLISGTGDFSIEEKTIKHYSGKRYSDVYQNFSGPDSFVLFFKKEGKIISEVNPSDFVDSDRVVLMIRKSTGP